jgi:hypothetical protein
LQKIAYLPAKLYKNRRNCRKPHTSLTTLQMTRVAAESKQFSAVTPVIAKVFQTSKRFLQLLQSFAKFWQAGKRFSAVTPIICKACLPACQALQKPEKLQKTAF